ALLDRPRESFFVLVRPSVTLVNPIGTYLMPDIDHELVNRDLEIVFAVAGPVGANLRDVSRTLGDALRKCDYQVEEIDIRTIVRQIAARRALTSANGSPIRLLETPEEMRVASYMDAGNAIRRLASNPAALAVAAIAEIRAR